MQIKMTEVEPTEQLKPLAPGIVFTIVAHTRRFLQSAPAIIRCTVIFFVTVLGVSREGELSYRSHRSNFFTSAT